MRRSEHGDLVLKAVSVSPENHHVHLDGPVVVGQHCAYDVKDRCTCGEAEHLRLIRGWHPCVHRFMSAARWVPEIRKDRTSTSGDFARVRDTGTSN